MDASATSLACQKARTAVFLAVFQALLQTCSRGYQGVALLVVLVARPLLPAHLLHATLHPPMVHHAPPSLSTPMAV